MKIPEYPRVTSIDPSDLLIVETSGGTKVAEYANVAGNKVDKIEGKGLSTEDYTAEDKEKVANIQDFTTGDVQDVKNSFSL